MFILIRELSSAMKEGGLFTHHSLLVTRYSLLVTRYSLLVIRYSLLVTRYSLLVTNLLVIFYSLLVVFYNLLVATRSRLTRCKFTRCQTYSLSSSNESKKCRLPRVLSIGGRGKLSPKRLISPSPKKVFPVKNKSYFKN